MEIGNVFPEVLNVTIDENSFYVDLIPNSTKEVNCIAIVRDWNGEDDIVGVNATFFDVSQSSENGPSNKNNHYKNSSCVISKNFGSYNSYSDDEFSFLANCSFYLEYYANPGLWQCFVTARDSYSWLDNGRYNVTVTELLSLGLPDIIDYGKVNATYVSDEAKVNVTNYGNVMVNLTLGGYAQTIGDGFAMNCSLPPSGTGKIPIYYEKYNLSESTLGPLTLSEFETFYVNLTSPNINQIVIKEFNLQKRTDENENNAIKPTFWRIYVPKGVAGNCTGNVVFGAVISPEN
ncbi:MAG: hypothetical protein QW103_00320 [Candidatus Pacearchaeota archaeon]